MAEVSLLWDNTGVGDASPHSEALVAAMFGALAGVGGANEGVLQRVLNELAPSAIAGATQVRIASGWAVVDGHPYRNDGNHDYTPATPSVGTTGRRAVLTCDWSAQTVRLVEISSADGTATIPALTQTPGTTYEIPICQYTVTTGGAIGAFVDEREFTGPTSASLLDQGLVARGEYVLAHFRSPGTVVLAGSGATTPLIAYPGLGFCLWTTHTGILRAAATAGDNGPRTRIGWNGAPSVQVHLSPMNDYNDTLQAIAPDRSPHFRALMTPQRPVASPEHWLAGFPVGTSATAAGAYFRRTTTGNVFAVTRQSSETTTDLGAMDDTTVRLFEVWTEDDGVTWQFAVDGVVVATHTTNVPTATTDLSYEIRTYNAGSGTHNPSNDVEEVLVTARK